MKSPIPKLEVAALTPVFPQTLHRVRTRGKKALLNPTKQKRDNIFSKSRDLREDRSVRQIKTTVHNSIRS